MPRMQATLDWKEEAEAAELVVVYLIKVEAPENLIEQARERAGELRKKAGLAPKAEEGN
jgi:hypothetical protein